jgi:transglutaminase-like putative cysteine protease
MRIKVLKSSAVNRSDVKIRYYSKDRKEDISNISAISYNLDAYGNIEETKMGKKDIFNIAIDKEYSQFSFAIPNVRTGTVFEYKYKVERKTFGYIPPWHFQQGIPVKYSAYDITIPEYFVFSVSSVKRQEMERLDNKDGIDTWYIMRNVPALKDEPYSSGRDTYLQRIEFQLAKIIAPDFNKEYRDTWPKLNEELLKDDDFGGVLKKNIQIDDEILTKLSGLNSIKEKVRTAYKYVQSNIQWNGRYGKYSDNGIKEAWEKKNAGITDINFILIKLLRAAGINAKPLLASTKDHGTVNTSYPFLNQFNCVLAYVKDSTETYIMNAADKYNPFDLVPYDVLYSNALLVDEHEGGLVKLDSHKQYTNNIFFTSSMTGDGKISGNTTISTSGYARNIRVKTYKEGKLTAFLENNEGITVKIDSISVHNEEDELLPFDQKFIFSGNLHETGIYLFLPYNLFTGIGKNPFTQENRIMKIDLDFPKNYMVSGSYILTDDYIVNELPKNKKITLFDSGIVLTRETQQQGNIITFNFTLNFNTPVYSAGNYPQIKEFYKHLYDMLNDRIVITKK